MILSSLLFSLWIGTTPCQSCAIEQEVVEEYLNPTVIQPQASKMAPVERDNPEKLLRDEMAALGLSEADIEIMLKISWCESRNIDTAKNPNSSASGRYQILQGTWEANSDYPWEDRYDWYANLSTAVKIYQRRGVQPWSQCL